MDLSGQDQQNNSLEDESNTLENSPSAPGESLESASGQPQSAGNVSSTPNQPPDKKHRLRGLWDKLNIYLLIFILLLIVAGVVAAVLLLKSNNGKAPPSVSTQSLSTDALKQLANSGTTVGDPKQVLNFESNSVFSGTVLLRQDLEVAGSIKVGAGLALPSLNVTGASTFNQLQVQKLAVAGDTAIQGKLSIQKDLSVNGSGTFNGTLSAPQVSTNSLLLGGTLTLDHHLIAGGAIPGRSNGNALGSGGTASVSGSDTAGSISIHTGGSPHSGCFVTITFAQRFSSTPHVVVTPIGSGAGGLSYYVNRSTGDFSVCTNSSAPSGASFGFDYIALD